MKLKEMQDFFKEDDFKEYIMNKIHEVLKPDIYRESSTGVRFRNVVKNGNIQSAIRCSKCGHIHLTSNDIGFNLNCPNCNEKLTVVDFGDFIFRRYYWDYRKGSEHCKTIVLYEEKIEAYIIAVVFRNYKQTKNFDEFFNIEDYSKNDFLERPIESVDKIYSICVFSEKYGLKYLDSDFRNLHVSTKDSSIFFDCIFKSVPCITKDYQCLLEKLENFIGYKTSVLSTSLKSYDNKMKNSRKKQSQTKQDVDIYNFCEKPKDEDIVKKINESSIDDTFSYIDSIMEQKIKYRHICSCGEETLGEHMLDNNRGNYLTITLTCPKCGKQIEKTIRCESDDKMIKTNNVNYWQKNGDIITIHYLAVSSSYKISTKEKSVDIKTKKIIMLTEKSVSLFISNSKGELVKQPLTKFCNEYFTITNINTKEEISKIINTTDWLLKRGLAHVYGLHPYEDCMIEPLGNFNKYSFLYKSYKKPYLEYTIKCNLKNITKELMSNSVSDNYIKAKNIYEMFDITKSVLKIARLENLNILNMNLVKSFYKIQSNFSLDMWRKLNQEPFDLSMFLRVIRNTETSIDKMLEYLQSAYDNQCIQKSQTLSIFDDYYYMAKKIGFNLNDNAIKFPNSLKKEHDKATFAYNVVKEELKTKAFKENSIINKKKYEYSFENLVVIVPLEPQEVIKEGQLQHHCVASYVSKIESGETCICFIRKKDEIELPYFTCEVRDEIIFQVKGFSNKYPDDKALITFIEKWAKSKNLKIDYMRH